ncbi:MAG: hypothetical protein V2A61_00510 [Calditrichota bacterium]
MSFLFKAALTALIVSVTALNSASAEEGKYRLGLQGSTFASGISGVMEYSSDWAVQGIISPQLRSFAFRGLNRFHQETNWNAYYTGSIGLWNDGFGLGLGVGAEYDWRGLSPSLPPLGWNAELGLSILPGIALTIGLGVHWKF